MYEQGHETPIIISLLDQSRADSTGGRILRDHNGLSVRSGAHAFLPFKNAKTPLELTAILRTLSVICPGIEFEL